jgi:hypothetical protein
MRVSVLVSICNRCDKLRLLLDTMKTKGSAWPRETEVLVIDNNLSDATKQVVAEYTSLENPASCFSRCLRVPIAMRRVYKPSL